MQIRIENFVRVKQAHIDAEPIALIVGANAAGKSSTLMGAALAATGVKAPYGFTQDATKELIHDGQAKATIAIGDPMGENEQSITYPGCTVRTMGGPPSASRFAVGLESLVDLAPKDRAVALQQMIKSEPTFDDLKAALVTEIIPESAVEAIWKLINNPTNGGWNVAWKRSQEMRATRKGEWQAFTGEQYGAEKADGWRPAGLTEDLMGKDVTEQTLSAAVTIAQGKVDDALKVQGGKVADIGRLQELAGELDVRREAKEEAEKDFQAAKEALEGAETERKGMPTATGDKAPPSDKCPCCGEVVEILVTGGGLAPSYKLVKPGTKTKGPTKAQLEKIASLDGSISRWTAERDRAVNRLGTTSAELKAAEEAKKLLEEIDRSPTEATDETEAALTQARADLAQAQQRLNLWKRWEGATKVQRLISIGDRVVDELAPTGLRQKKMAESLLSFNEKLANLATVAKWPKVEIKPEDMSIWYEGRPLTSVTAKSYRARARYLLAFGAAEIDGSQLVICDEADILEPDARKGLLQLAKASGKNVLIGVTMRADAAPNLAQWKGWGATYVLKDGVAEKLAVASSNG